MQDVNLKKKQKKKNYWRTVKHRIKKLLNVLRIPKGGEKKNLERSC